MPQSVWWRITRCPLGGWPWPSRPSRAHERSVAGVIRPPMLRITTPSPSSRPSTSLGSTRESTQPSTCRVSLVGKGRPANAPVAANAALRRTSSPEEMITSSEHTRRRTFDTFDAHTQAAVRSLQQRAGLPTTGVVGPQTKHTLSDPDADLPSTGRACTSSACMAYISRGTTQDLADAYPDSLPARWSGDRSRYQFGDLLFHLAAPLRERVRHRPHAAVVEVRRVLEAQGRVAVVELARVLEEDDDLAVGVRVRGHPVPGLRRQLGRGRGDRHMHALGQRTILRCHLRDAVEDRLQAVGLLGALLALGAQLGGALLHRGTLLGGEAAGLGIYILRGHFRASFLDARASVSDGLPLKG